MRKAAYQGKTLFGAYGSRKMRVYHGWKMWQWSRGDGQEGRQVWCQEQRVEVHILKEGRTESELEMAPGFESPPLVTYFLKEGHMTQTSHKQHCQLGTKYSNTGDLKAGGIYYSNHHSAPESPLSRGIETEV